MNLCEDFKKSDIILADMVYYFVRYLNIVDYETWFPYTPLPYDENQKKNTSG
jgi:hypothetical protein